MEENTTRIRLGQRLPLWVVGVAIGAVFLAVGIWQDQFEDIYHKAVMICLECIGIG